MIDPLTENEKRVAINRAIEVAYPKMLKDFKRITSYNSDKFEDLLQFCLSEFLTKKSIDYQYKLCVTDNKLVNYMGRSMSLNLRSSTSPYWALHRKSAYNSRGTYLVEYEEHGKHDLPEIQDPDIQLKDLNARECVYWALEQLDFYYKALLTDYFINDMIYKDIHKKYGIPLHHVRKDVDDGVKLLQEHCSQFMPKK